MPAPSQFVSAFLQLALKRGYNLLLIFLIIAHLIINKEPVLAWLDQLNLAKAQSQPMLKVLADTTQKIVLKDAFDQQANKQLEINLNKVLLKIMIWHAPDQF